MRSKMVNDRLKSNDHVTEALRQHGSKAGARTEQLLTPYLKKGEKMPDLALLSELLARKLDDQGAKMDAADSAHNAELADDAEPREARDEAAQKVYDVLVSVKGGVTTMFGAEWLAKLGLPAELPRDPSALAALARAVAKALGDTKLPKPKLRGVKSFDVAPWIDDLNQPLPGLTKAIKDVTREVREAQGTLSEKNKAIDTYDEIFSLAVPIAATMMRFAGEEALAAKLRPSIKRPGTLESDASAAPDETPTDAAAPADPIPGKDG